MYNHQLETFIRVADAGSFNKAAEESYITPTAIIKQINLLEDSLGVKLFKRTRRGLTLTKAGRSMYQNANYLARIHISEPTRLRRISYAVFCSQKKHKKLTALCHQRAPILDCHLTLPGKKKQEEVG